MARTRLPNRRNGENISFRVGKLEYHANLSFDEEGNYKEIFLVVGKTGSEAHTLARDVGILVSLLLQYGCPIKNIASALTRNPDGSADGPLGILLDLITKDD